MATELYRIPQEEDEDEEERRRRRREEPLTGTETAAVLGTEPGVFARKPLVTPDTALHLRRGARGGRSASLDALAPGAREPAPPPPELRRPSPEEFLEAAGKVSQVPGKVSEMMRRVGLETLHRPIWERSGLTLEQYIESIRSGQRRLYPREEGTELRRSPFARQFGAAAPPGVTVRRGLAGAPTVDVEFPTPRPAGIYTPQQAIEAGYQTLTQPVLPEEVLERVKEVPTYGGFLERLLRLGSTPAVAALFLQPEMQVPMAASLIAEAAAGEAVEGRVPEWAEPLIELGAAGVGFGIPAASQAALRLAVSELTRAAETPAAKKAIEAAFDALVGAPGERGAARLPGKPHVRADEVVQPPRAPPPGEPPAAPPGPPKEPSFAPGEQLSDEASLALDIQVGVNEDVGRVVRWAGRVPGIRHVINLANGSALLESERVGYTAVRRIRRAELWETEATRFEEQMKLQGERLFKIDNNGLIKGIGEPWQDVFENPTRFWPQLSAKQREYIILWHQIKNAHKAVVPAEAWRGLLGRLAKGEDFLADSWVPHYVLETRGVQRGPLVRRRFGAKQASERGRFYETVVAGSEKGNVYHNSPAGTLGVLLRTYGQMTADAEARPLLQAMTLRPQELLSGAVQERAFTAANALKVAKRQLRFAEGAARGEEWVTRIGHDLLKTMPQKQQNLLGKVQQALRAGRAGRRAALEQAVAEARANLKAAQAEFDAAKAARARALEALRGGTAEHPLVPRDVPGLTGRLAESPEVYDELVKWFGQRVPGGVDLLAALNAVILPVRAVGDLSYTFLQGLMTIFSNPTAAFRSWVVGLESVAFRSDFYRAVMGNLQRKGIIARWIRGRGNLGAVDYIVAPTTGPWPVRKAAGVINWTLTPFARAWTRSRNVGALVNFEGRYRLYRAKFGRELTDQELHELVSVTDKMTGVVNPAALGVQATQRAIERSVRFAPSYYRAYLGLFGDLFQGGLRGKEARRIFGLFIAGGAASYYAAATGLNQEPDFDFSSPNFMTLEIKGQKVGFGGVYYHVVRLIGEIAQAVDEGNWKKLYDIRSGRHPLWRESRSGAAPILSILWDLGDRATYIGEPLDSWQAVLKHTFASLTPFAAQTAIEEGPEQILPQFFGLRGFPRFPREIAEETLDKPMENWTRLDWANLKAEDPKTYGELQDSTQKAARRGEEWAIVIVQEQRIAEDFNGRVNELESDPNPSSRMERYIELLVWRGGQYDLLRSQHEGVYNRRSDKDLNTREQEIVAEGREKLELLEPGMDPLTKMELLEEYDRWESRLEPEELAFWDTYRDVDVPPWLKAHRQRSRVLDRRYDWWNFKPDLWKRAVGEAMAERYPTYAHYRHSIQQELTANLLPGEILSAGAVDAWIRDNKDSLPWLKDYLRDVGTGKDSRTDQQRRDLPAMEALLLAQGSYGCALTREAITIAEAPPLNVRGISLCERAD